MLRSRAALASCLAALLLALVVLSGAPETAAQTTPTLPPGPLPLQIDQTVFLSSVPGHVSIGHNYTVRVLLRNTSDKPVPVLVRVSVPIEALLVKPLLTHGLVLPRRTLMENFSVIPYNQNYRGQVNVTALLWVWFTANMAQPVLVQSVSTLIYVIGPSGVSTELIALLAVGIGSLVVATSVLAVRWARKG